MLSAVLQEPHLSAAARILAQASACDHCLGRCFGKVGTGLTNDQRGKGLREALGRAPTPAASCEVCHGLFSELDALAGLVVEAWGDLEFRTFLIGTRVDPDIQEREQALWALAEPARAESVSAELNREVGKRVSARSAKEVDTKKPDVTSIVDTRFDVVELNVAPLFLYGRYRKLVRDIPQTRWPCRQCKGRGCHACGMTGKQYATSVQELVQAPALAAFQARDADFHGMGREDIDARCLGAGRPFVLELREPRRRTADLAALQDAMNAHGAGRVEVEGLRASRREEVAWVKGAESRKAYRAEVAFAGPVEEKALREALAQLAQSEIAQRTPQRVEHRRALLTRHRAVLAAEVEAHAGSTATLRIAGEAGLYIKELVSGDEGRTRPSLAELLGVGARVTALDVVAVEERPMPSAGS